MIDRKTYYTFIFKTYGGLPFSGNNRHFIKERVQTAANCAFDICAVQKWSVNDKGEHVLIGVFERDKKNMSLLVE